MSRVRWAAVGAAVAVAVAGGVTWVSATNPSDATVFVPITPCRVMDTRPDSNVGPKSSPLGPGETHTIDTTSGDTGECGDAIPAAASGVSLNVTALNASTISFLTIWATGETRPNAANLNPAPGQPPVPNAVVTGIDGDGRFNIFNAFGQVNVVTDINGYYIDHDHDDRYYTEDEIDGLLAGVAGVGTAYTKAETDALLDDKADTSDVYTKTQSDAFLDDKADTSDVYTRAEADERFYEGDSVVLVPADGTPAENGTALKAAVAGISDATADNPYLVRLSAGVYDVGATGLDMVDHVSIEGAGRRATIIQGAGEADSGQNEQGTVKLADEVVLSDVLVRNSGGAGTYAAGVQGLGLDWLVHDVRIEMTANDASFVAGLAASSQSGSPEFGGVADTVEIEIFEGTGASFAVTGIGSDIFIGDTEYLVVRNADITLNVAGTGIGDIAADSSNEGLFVYDTSITLLAGGLGAGQSGADVQLYDNVDMRVEGGSGTNIGFSSAGSGFRPEIVDSTIDVSGGASGYGISTNTGFVLMRNSELTASSIAMRSTGTSSSFGATYRFHNSILDAPTGFEIDTDGTGTFRFQTTSSHLDASTNVDVTNTGGGTVDTDCMHTTDENFVKINDDCS